MPCLFRYLFFYFPDRRWDLWSLLALSGGTQGPCRLLHGSGSRAAVSGWRTRCAAAALNGSRECAASWAVLYSLNLSAGSERTDTGRAVYAPQVCAAWLAQVRCSPLCSAGPRRSVRGGSSLCLCAGHTAEPPALLACSVLLAVSIQQQNPMQSPQKIYSLQNSSFSNLHFWPCLKQVLSYPKWSLFFLPSCCPGKFCLPPKCLLHIQGTDAFSLALKRVLTIQNQKVFAMESSLHRSDPLVFCSLL